jgi:hypothetical protein
VEACLPTGLSVSSEGDDQERKDARYNVSVVRGAIAPGVQGKPTAPSCNLVAPRCYHRRVAKTQVPVISQLDIDHLVSAPKPVADIHWRQKLLPPRKERVFRQSTFELGDTPLGPLRGSLHIYSRWNLRDDPDDWSIGLVYTDLLGNTYRLVRCNGPHPHPHRNHLENESFSRSPHVHQLTERYLISRWDGDQYATPTSAFSTPENALDHLATLASLEPVGTLFL